MAQASGYTVSGYKLTIPAYDVPSIQPDAALLGLIHVSIVVTRRPLTDRRFVLVWKEDGTLIYKNTADAGPAYLVLPRSDGKPPSPDHAQWLNAGVRAITLAPEQETFTFSTGAAGYFVIATPAFPGWNVELDGRPVPVQLFAGVMPTIKVDPGRHSVSYTYAPLSVRLGALLSGIGLLAALIWLLAGRLWKPGKQRRSRKDEMACSCDLGEKV